MKGNPTGVGMFQQYGTYRTAPKPATVNEEDKNGEGDKDDNKHRPPTP